MDTEIRCAKCGHRIEADEKAVQLTVGVLGKRGGFVKKRVAGFAHDRCAKLRFGSARSVLSVLREEVKAHVRARGRERPNQSAESPRNAAHASADG